MQGGGCVYDMECIIVISTTYRQHPVNVNRIAQWHDGLFEKLLQLTPAIGQIRFWLGVGLRLVGLRLGSLYDCSLRVRVWEA